MRRYQEIWSPMTESIDQNQIRMIEDDGTIRFVPKDDGNMDWRAYQEWLDEGNYPLKHDAEI